LLAPPASVKWVAPNRQTLYLLGHSRYRLSVARRVYAMMRVIYRPERAGGAPDQPWGEVGGAAQTISGYGFAMPHSDGLVPGWNH
jgi:hypothetical protein